MTGHSESQSDRPQTHVTYTAGAGETFPRLLGMAAVLLAAIFVGLVVYGSSASSLLGTLALEVILVLTWVLVRSGRTRVASMIFPSLGWGLMNLTILSSGLAEPMLLAGANAVVTLVAAALLGPSGVLPLTALTVLLGITLALLDVSGLLEPSALPPIRPAVWIMAGAVYALISWFGYSVLRRQSRSAQEAQRRAAELETLTNAAAAITASLERDEAIRRILRQLAKVVPYDSASVQLLRDGYLEIVGGRGWNGPETVIGVRFPVPDDNPNTTVLETRQPLILNDAPSAHPPFRQPPHDHIRSWLGVPLVVGKRVVGMLAIDSAQPDQYDEQHAQMVAAFADHVAIALENARLFEAEQRRRELATAEQQITQITGSSLELDTLLRQVARRTAAAVMADRCLIFLHDDGSETLKLASAQTSEEDAPAQEVDLLSSRTVALGDLGLERQHMWGQLAAFGPGSDEQPPPQLWRQTLDAQRMLVAPLVTHDHFQGALALIHREPEAAFDREQIGLVHTVAASLAASLENARLYTQMERLAVTDPLTDLYNRRGLEQLSQREIERFRRYGRPMSLMMLDLDNFKALNDEHGHPVGDEVLVGLADLLRRTLRSVDVTSRYGGEEFVITLPECGLEQAERAAERVREQIEACAFDTEAGELRITVSIGVASAEGDLSDLRTLIDRADQAMYAAKQAGPNQVWAWHQDGLAPARSG